MSCSRIRGTPARNGGIEDKGIFDRRSSTRYSTHICSRPLLNRHRSRDVVPFWNAIRSVHPSRLASNRHHVSCISGNISNRFKTWNARPISAVVPEPKSNTKMVGHERSENL